MHLTAASLISFLRVAAILLLGLASVSGLAQGNPVPPDRTAASDGVSTPDTSPWPANTVPQLLGGWLFEPDRVAAAISEPPRWSTNAFLVPADDVPGMALRLNSTGPAAVRFGVRQANQLGEFSVRHGSLSVWIRPHWTTGGTGSPTQRTPLIEVGTATPERLGWWALCLAPGGGELTLHTQSGGVEAIPLRAPVSFTANQWTHLALTWSSSRTALFVNGQRLGTGPGVTRWPLLAERERWGWGIGGDGTGLLQVRADFDTLLTFNFPLDDAAVPRLAQQRSPSVAGLDSGIVRTGLWLQPTGEQNGIRQGLLHGTVAGLAYELFGAPKAEGPWRLEDRFNGLNTQTAYGLPVGDGLNLFLVAASFEDTDGDGLSDEYEKRVSRTSLTNPDTDGDGMPDGWEAEHGLDPRLADDGVADPDQDGFPNELEYRLGRDPGQVEGVPVVTVTPELAEVGEASSGTHFVLRRTAPVDRAVEVYFELKGRAANGSDYQWIPGRATFAAGASQVKVALRPVNDALDEETEPVTLELVSGPEYGLGTTRSATVNLVDNDLPVISLVATDPLAREPWATWTDTGEFEVRRDGLTAQALTVSLARGGTAVSGTDDQGVPSSIQIPAGEVAVRFKVTPKDNRQTTGARTVVMSLKANATAYGISPTAGVAQVTIQDIQPPEVSVVASDAEAGENANPGTFKFTRTGSTAEPLVVRYRIGGTATSAGIAYDGADYTGLSGVVTIPAGKVDVVVPVTPVGDGTAETVETVSVGLTGSMDYSLGASSEATLTLDDTSPMTLVSQTLVAVSGPTVGPFAQIEVIRTGSVAAAVTVPLEVQGRRLWNNVWYDFKNVPAAAGASYGLFVDGQPAASLTFPRGVHRRLVSLKAMQPSATVPAATVVLNPASPTLRRDHPIKFIDPEDYITMSATTTDLVEGTAWRVTLSPGSTTSGPDGTTVRLRLSGEASLSEYTVTGGTVSGEDLVVSIPPVVPGNAQRQVVVTVTPRADGLVEPVSEHVVLKFDQTVVSAGLVSVQQSKPYVAGRIRDNLTQPVRPLDVDGDGLPDDYEVAQGSDPLVPGRSLKDTDKDGVSDPEEFRRGTRYDLADTDGDGVNDFIEGMLALNPLVKDAGGIGLEQDLVPIRLRTAGTFRYAQGGCYECHAPEMDVGGIQLTERTADSGSDEGGVLERLVLLRAGTSHTVKLMEPPNAVTSPKGNRYDAEILAPSAGVPPGFVVFDHAVPLLGRNVAVDSTTFTRTATLRVLARPRLAVDGNRDGTIRFDTSDDTSAQRPYRFWVNNDSDVGENEHMTGTPDHLGGKIMGVRDVEDLARLWIALDGMDDLWAQPGFRLALEWRGVTAGQPAIQLYSASAWRTGGRQYLETEEGAKDQAGMPIPGNEVALADESTRQYTLKPGVRLVLPPKAMERVEASRRHLVFEGAASGQGSLVAMVLRDGVIISESAPLHLRLMDIKEMYQRQQAGPVDGFAPAFESPWVEPLPVTPGLASWPMGFEFSPAPDETPQATVFVHGWNMPEIEASKFSETLFKRLWHQGYTGRLVSFRWPTYLLQQPTLVDSFNASEHRAWEYGAALKMLLDGLPAPYKRNVIAHSMGGVVTSSAIRLGADVDNVLMMQAAVAASAYDSRSELNWSTLSTAEADAPLQLKTPNLFSGDRGYGGMMGGRGARVFNYHNFADFALQTGNFADTIDVNWVQNQILQKPHWPGMSQPRRYRWVPGAPASGPDLRYRLTHHQRADQIQRFVTQTHEILSYVARSRTRALGAEPRALGWVEPQDRRDLSEGLVVFTSSREDHSGQFNRCLFDVWGLYRAIDQDLQGGLR